MKCLEASSAKVITNIFHWLCGWCCICLVMLYGSTVFLFKFLLHFCLWLCLFWFRTILCYKWETYLRHLYTLLLEKGGRGGLKEVSEDFYVQAQKVPVLMRNVRRFYHQIFVIKTPPLFLNCIRYGGLICNGR